MNKLIKYLRLLLLFCIIVLTVGCQADVKVDSPIPTNSVEVKATEQPTHEPVRIEGVELKEDPSYLDVFNEDPYMQISYDLEEREKFDKELYNYLYQAMLNGEKTVDISAFSDVSEEKRMNSITLLGVGAFHISKFYYAGYSEDISSAILHYKKDEEDMSESDIIYWKQLNHLLYNVAPSHYSDYQRFFAVYDYICKYADYTDDMQDESTLSVYSILSKKKGICGTFSLLAYRVLNFVGVPTECLANEAHAWNIVELDGTRFQTDITWGAGLPNTNESLLYTALMSDDVRMEGIQMMGFGDQEIYRGFINKSDYEPCTNSKYDFLQYIYQNYALDIDNGYIYYSIGDSVVRIGLDATGQETIFDQYGDFFVCYNGILYFRGSKISELYRYLPNEGVELIDNSIDINHMEIVDGILTYGPYDESSSNKEMDLSPFRISQFPNEKATILEQMGLDQEQTFSIEVRFSEEMDTTCEPIDLIGLITDSNNNLPLHMVWGDDKKTLTIRSKTCILDETGVSLYIKEGIKSNNGNMTRENQILKINYY